MLEASYRPLVLFQIIPPPLMPAKTKVKGQSKPIKFCCGFQWFNQLYTSCKGRGVAPCTRTIFLPSKKKSWWSKWSVQILALRSGTSVISNKFIHWKHFVLFLGKVKCACELGHTLHVIGMLNRDVCLKNSIHHYFFYKWFFICIF